MPGWSNYAAPLINVNTEGNGRNCFYCTVSALTRNTTDGLATASEALTAGKANMPEIVSLFSTAGAAVVGVGPADASHISNEVKANIAVQSACGLAYTRSGGSRYMVVLRNMHGSMDTVDYSTRPPTVGSWPPEGNIGEFFLFYLR